MTKKNHAGTEREFTLHTTASASTSRFGHDNIDQLYNLSHGVDVEVVKPNQV